MQTEIQKTDIDEKRRFAKLIAKLGSPHKAAEAMYPHNINRKLYVAMKWPEDPIVVECLSYELENMDNAAGKAELARLLWERLDKCEDAFVKPIGELYAKVMGFIQNGDVIDNRRTTNVMVMPAQKNELDFAKGCLAQQRNLLIESSGDN